MFETELLPEFHTDLVPALSNLKSDYLSRHFFSLSEEEELGFRFVAREHAF
jgi:hypothetical protein